VEEAYNWTGALSGLKIHFADRLPTDHQPQSPRPHTHKIGHPPWMTLRHDGPVRHISAICGALI
jgi:hypothetical protein